MVPREIGRAGEHDVRVAWPDREDVHVARDLRLACSCAACVDEVTGVRRLDPATVPGDVRPMRIEPVGRYAIHIAWSDGHQTGIYTFEYLRRLGENRPRC